MTDTEKLTLLLKVLKEYAEKENCYDLGGDDYTPANNGNYYDAFDDGADYGEITFARTLLEQIGVEFQYPVRGRRMTDTAQKIWKVFCEELTQEPTDDMREALATSIREVANELQYYNTSEGVDMILDAYKLYELADELEVLNDRKLS
tara:strand:+ start:47 stop:490 length:444 start_codon:yes stop_codon:yes gene_type:complete